MTIEAAREKAAQLWCEPQHAHKEMDVDFAESIAQLLVRETAPFFTHSFDEEQTEG